eukprot:3581473-Prymnesium_polylepis.1
MGLSAQRAGEALPSFHDGPRRGLPEGVKALVVESASKCVHGTRRIRTGRAHGPPPLPTAAPPPDLGRAVAHARGRAPHATCSYTCIKISQHPLHTTRSPR